MSYRPLALRTGKPRPGAVPTRTNTRSVTSEVGRSDSTDDEDMQDRYRPTPSRAEDGVEPGDARITPPEDAIDETSHKYYAEDAWLPAKM